MEKITVDLPTMYGDHHVTEVREILLKLPGVEDVYASSAFHQVQISFDKKKTPEKEIRSKLEEAGYSGEMLIAKETGKAEKRNGNSKTFRHTASYKQLKDISFARETSSSGRTLWPCPGMGPLPSMED